MRPRLVDAPRVASLTRRGLPRMALALTLVVASGSARAELVRLVDEDGVIHYTNEPCQPRYAPLAPERCAAPAPASPDADATPAAAPSPLAQEIERSPTRHGVDPRLGAAVVRVESGGDPEAISPKRAQGLMQLMPARARARGVRDAFDPAVNLDGGVRHLRDLLARYAGNVPLALAAYNAGEEAVRAYGGMPPYPETQAYVRKILAMFDASGRHSSRTIEASKPPHLEDQPRSLSHSEAAAAHHPVARTLNNTRASVAASR
jgi:soluble lytic murein transglycosylase-like protein